MLIRHFALSRILALLMFLIVSAAVVAQDAANASQAESQCSLADQIRAQNTGRLVDDCKVLKYPDVFQLREDIVLSEPLPAITSRLKIDGQGHTISGDGRFRIFTVDGGSLSIANLHMIRGAASWGSAISADHGASVRLRDSSVKYNEARSGGTISVRFSLLIVNNSEIARNSADRGGAIESSASTVYVDKSVIANNSAKFGGAMKVAGGSATITNSELRSNEAEVSGGAIDSSYGGTIQIRDTQFSHNYARTGGAIYRYGDNSLLTISRSRFSHNASRLNGGAIYVAGNPEVYISDSEFHFNSARHTGGAIAAKNGSLFISYSSVEKNRSMVGSGIYVLEGSVTILDTTIADNESTESGDQLDFIESDMRFLDIRGSGGSRGN